MKYLTLLLVFLSLEANAATFYVAKNGNDSNTGTSASPWATISKGALTALAGDTVIIRDGDYDENVQQDKHGSASAPITFKAENMHAASLRAFRISANYIVLDGLKFSSYSAVNNQWGSTVRIENDGDNSTIKNCLFTDYPQVKANDFVFDASLSKISSASADFVAAGFQVGSKIYLGASGASYQDKPLYYNNHDRLAIIQTLSTHSITVSFTDGNPMIADSGSGYWAYLFSSSVNQYGNPAVYGYRSAGDNPDNVKVLNNIIRKWAGTGITWFGDGWLVDGNSLYDNSAGSRAIIWNGSNNTIKRNIVKNYKQPLYYSKADMSTVVHPAGAGWYDWVTQMIASSVVTTLPQINNLVEENWFENLESPIGRVDDEASEAYNIVFNKNIFIGLSGPMAGGRDGMQWTNNTFYRVGYSDISPLTIGGRPPAQTGYVLTGNLFVACGGRGVNANNGWYGISSNAISPLVDRNFVCNEEVTGYAPKEGFSEVNGINGGDPVFYDVLDYDGPDDTPFTDDDGLKVLASSPLAKLGGGALGVRPVVSGQPVAHFRLTKPTGWFEPIDESYNPTWDDVPPTKRAGLNRAWDTPVIIGTAPVEVSFNAEKSISAVNNATSNSAITSYSWNFEGTAAVLGMSPSYVFRSAGIKIVSLTVTNSLGNSHTTRRVYRVLGPDEQSAPAAVQNLRIVN